MNNLEQAITVLKQGGIIIYPTDTAFGIGCRIDDNDAVKKLFSIRERPLNKSVPVLFDSIEMVKKYVTSIPPSATSLMEKYWPGGLTLILPANTQRVTEMIRSEIGIGCRIPNHETPLTLIKELGVPIIGTSANFAGLPTPYSFSDLDSKLMSLVDLVISGITYGHKESTVIDCTQDPFRILRQGAITIEGNEL